MRLLRPIFRLIFAFCGDNEFYCLVSLHIKVDLRAEILPRDFLQTLGNYCLSFTIAKIQSLKKFHC